MRRPRFSRSPAPPRTRINGRIRAREVRVVGPDGGQLGVMALHEAIRLARAQEMDLVEVAASANPPVCRIIDYGRFRYEQSKREKESKKHQHSNRVKEVQLTPTIDAHDMEVKVGHAIDFLCEDMKVKASLRFRGRQMAHQDVGREVLGRFIEFLAPYGQPSDTPKLAGRHLNVMLNPLPRNKRAKNPRVEGSPRPPGPAGQDSGPEGETQTGKVEIRRAADSEAAADGSFANAPFERLESPSGDS